MVRKILTLRDMLEVFPRNGKKLDPANFFNAALDGSHPLLPPLAEFIINDDEDVEARNDLVPGRKLSIQTIYSWMLHLMMTYGKGMKPCLLHPQFWQKDSVGTENAANYTVGNRHDFDILFIPILRYDPEHWTLAVWRAGIITYYDSMSFPVSPSTTQRITEIVKSSREGMKVHSWQVMKCCKQVDAINCGMLVLISAEQLLRTGEVWAEDRIADRRFKNRYINHAKLRMRRILCPKHPNFPESKSLGPMLGRMFHQPKPLGPMLYKPPYQGPMLYQPQYLGPTAHQSSSLWLIDQISSYVSDIIESPKFQYAMSLVL